MQCSAQTTMLLERGKPEFVRFQIGLNSDGGEENTPNVKLAERFTRVSPTYINWAITVDDAGTWTRAWTFMIRLKHTDDQLLRVRL